MKECQLRMEFVFLAHRRRVDSICVPVSYDGVPYRLRGRIVTVVDLSAPSVTLLSKESTPEHRVPDQDAERLFKEAAARCIETDGTFYTLPHPNWALPAFKWEKM